MRNLRRCGGVAEFPKVLEKEVGISGRFSLAPQEGMVRLPHVMSVVWLICQEDASSCV